MLYMKLIVALTATQSVLSCPAAKKSSLRADGKIKSNIVILT